MEENITPSRSILRRYINLDITFCDFWKDCAKAKECPRALTPELVEEIDKVAHGHPISHFMDKPECWLEK